MNVLDENEENNLKKLIHFFFLFEIFTVPCDSIEAKRSEHLQHVKLTLPT